MRDFCVIQLSAVHSCDANIATGAAAIFHCLQYVTVTGPFSFLRARERSNSSAAFRSEAGAAINNGTLRYAGKSLFFG